MKTVNSLIAVAGVSISCTWAAAQSTNSEVLHEVTIIGSSAEARAITGSAHVIDSANLREFSYTDIQRVIREVPGVSLQVEDGYGLRPNISIRGVATERSGRITLLEDNILIAPAPYSAPSAYYFPTVGRINAFEVLKGPAAITQGPYTIGGALNMVSTPIPERFGGNMLAEAGEDSTYRVHAYYGGRTDSGLGFLLETHQWQSDGFQSIDRSSRDTGLDVKDFTIKLSYMPADSPHSIDLKVQKADQNSNQSYVGLTDQDFDSDAFRRYGLTELDNIRTSHNQQILRYQFELNDQVSLSATAYNNELSRNWLKTEGIDIDGSASAESFSRTSWFNVTQAINTNRSLSGTTPSELQGILDGTIDTADGSIQLRANDRAYYSRGLQFTANAEFNLGQFYHYLQIGIRIHEDEEDRLQRNSTYSQRGGKLQLFDLGELGNAGNRVQEAKALAVYIYDSIQWGSWTLTPGLRYEDIDQQRTRFGDGPARSFRDSRNNSTRVLLPGLGALYQLTDAWSVLGGVHKGFTAPSNSPGVKEEEALNYELGFRYQEASFNAEVIGFLSDYDNLLGECTSSSGSDCIIGDAFNGEAATVRGVEALLNTNLVATTAWKMPFSLSYTYIDGSFDTDIAGTDFFGDVSAGDPIPYLPSNQVRVSLSLQTDNWSISASGNYIDEVCVRSSCDEFEKTDDSFTVDVVANLQLNNSTDVFARLENLTGEEDIMARHPYGARPNKDTTASLGLRLNF